MTTIEERFQRTTRKLGNLESRLKVVQQDYKKYRKAAYKATKEKEHFRKLADDYGHYGNFAGTRKLEKTIRSADHAAERQQKNHTRAQWKLGKIKEYQQRIHNLEMNKEKILHNLERYKREHGVRINGNRVTGGTDRERLRAALEAAAANCASGTQHNFYSQSGGWNIERCIRGMPYDCRFDCSSFATGIHWSCGLDDPNGQDYKSGYTGDLMSHCERISRREAQVGDFVIYGSYPGHHVEVVLDPEKEITIGHGSAPIDRGVFNLFGDGNYGFYRNPALK